ncbi:MAG: DUF4838 domain-containing protein, partial [Dehalococcoidales bacterium]|nr:DUF4838 domain-containing protein [Dehalococcoidales bacterium]
MDLKRSGKHLSLGRAILMVVLAASMLLTPSVAEASSVTGWGGISTIYYAPSQDDAANHFLREAAQDLRDNLQQAGRSLVITTATRPASGSIYLEVNPALTDLAGKGEEAFRLYTDGTGIYITGKTSLAVRDGVYTLLDKLGFRWFFTGPVWWVKPDTLVYPEGLNEVQEPFYYWRRVYVWSRINPTGVSDWAKRNRLFGAEDYSCDQNYYKIAAYNNYGGYGSLDAMYAAHPEWFLPEGTAPTGNMQWELRPDNPDVAAMATAYARDLLSSPLHRYASSNYLWPYGAVPIAPNDDAKWDPPWNHTADWQTITDKVFHLANEVARNIQAEFPGALLCAMSYSTYSGIPTFPLQPNLLVMVSTEFNRSPLTFEQRLDGMLAKGVHVGVFDFYGEWVYWQDLPLLNLSKIRALTSYAQKGIRAFHTQTGGDAWGVTGLTSYAASKMLWDPFQDFDAILSDFYSKAFGPAASVMQRYYGRYQDTAPMITFRAPPSSLPQTVGDCFHDLAEAESLVGGNAAYLERIRELEYYQRFLWFYHVRGLANLGLDELKSFYAFVTRIRDLYIIDYAYDEPAVRAELKNRGLVDSQIDALQDFTPPTAAEASAWLNEALAAFPAAGIPPVANSQSVTTDENSPVAISLSASSPGGNPLTYNIVGYPAHGSLSGSPPALTYTPEPGFTGADSFTFTASDGSATSNIATVSVTVEP